MQVKAYKSIPALFFGSLLFVIFMLMPNKVQSQSHRVLRTNIVGGYNEASPDDKRVMNAASFAVNLIGVGEAQPLESYSFTDFLVAFHAQRPSKPLIQEGDEEGLKIQIVKVKQQVVAGMNYDMTIELSIGMKCVGGFEVTVYDQFGDLTVTKWGKELPCADKLDEKNAADEISK